MRNIITAIMIPAACMSLCAQNTGRIAGTVLGKNGKPVPGAVVTLSRQDINWSKPIKVNDQGNYMQVGLEPKEFKVSVTAPGCTPINEIVKIVMGDTVTKNYTLMTTQESADEAIRTGVGMDPNAAKAISASTAFNSGIELYNQQKFAEALPFIEKAVNEMHEAIGNMKEGEVRTKLEAQTATADRVYGVVLTQVGKGDPAKKDMVLKAESYLMPAYQKNPKDQTLVVALLEVAKAKEDAAAIKTYQAALDAIIGPRPEVAYNDGVTAFNDGRFKEAKESVDKAIALDPKFPDSYWLLGVVEFSMNNTKAAKEAFKKYLEIAPTGKKAGEVREFLKELK